jgi:hypothetical protein
VRSSKILILLFGLVELAAGPRAKAENFSRLGLNFGYATSAKECVADLVEQTQNTSAGVTASLVELASVKFKVAPADKQDFPAQARMTSFEEQHLYSKNRVKTNGVGEVQFNKTDSGWYCTWKSNLQLDISGSAFNPHVVSSLNRINLDSGGLVAANGQGPMDCAVKLLTKHASFLLEKPMVTNLQLAVHQNRAEAQNNDQKIMYLPWSSRTSRYRVTGSLSAFGRSRALAGEAVITFINQTSAGDHPNTTCWLNPDTETSFSLNVKPFEVEGQAVGSNSELIHVFFSDLNTSPNK